MQNLRFGVYGYRNVISFIASFNYNNVINKC